MNLSINGQSQVPPGFRFHPTEEELLHYYLRKKVAYEKIDLDVIREVDLNKLEPWDIQEKCRIGSTPQNDWYFFSHKDKKYPTGTRTNRATTAGFWKATGRDKIIYSGCQRIGLRKTLVFYKGRAPNGQKSDWIMHEYRLDENNLETTVLSSAVDMNMAEEGWVVCRVFKKKNYQRALDSPRSVSVSPSTDSKIQMLCSPGNQVCVLDQILSYMGRASCKIENRPSSNIKGPENNKNDIAIASNNNGHNTNKLSQFPPDGIDHKDRFIHLPRLESPTVPLPPFDQYHQSFEELMLADAEPAGSSDAPTPDDSNPIISLSDWATLDRLVASQLNGHGEITEPAAKLNCFENNLADLHHGTRPCRVNNSLNHQGFPVFGCESNFFWGGFTGKDSSSSTSSDPLRHLSV